MALSLVVLLGPVLLLFRLYQWVSGGATPARVDQGPRCTPPRWPGCRPPHRKGSATGGYR